MKYYITFGQVHVHSVNSKTFDKDCVAVIDAPSYGDARERAFELFSDKWHNCYTEAEWNDELLSYFPRGLINMDGESDDSS